MKIPDTTALRLYLNSKAGVTMVHKESIAQEEAELIILGVPCVVNFGFSSATMSSGPVVTSACVWIFSGSCVDFFGSFYLLVHDEAQAPAILNSTIGHAVEQVKANQKFHAINAVVSAGSSSGEIK